MNTFDDLRKIAKGAFDGVDPVEYTRWIRGGMTDAEEKIYDQFMNMLMERNRMRVLLTECLEHVDEELAERIRETIQP